MSDDEPLIEIDPNLKRFATEAEWEYMEALAKYGSGVKAAEALGVSKATVNDARKRLIERAARLGYAPQYGLVHEIPPGFVLRGTSIRYDGEGKIDQYWNKTRLDGRDESETVQLPDPKKITKRSTLYDQQGRVTQQWIAEKPSDEAREQLWRLFADELARTLPQIEPIPEPQHTALSSMWLSGYPVGDQHMGMLSWEEETGANWDLRIAETTLTHASTHLIQTAPPSDQALIAFLGDFLHYDGPTPVTPTHKNVLDSDTRFPKMVRASIRVMRYMIETAAKKHGEVDVIVEIGNHDLASSVMLAQCFANLYERESRIRIDTSPKHFHYMEFGKVGIGTHHGHGVKRIEDLALIMATDVPELWGRTAHRYIWTGHIHNRRVFDVPGAEIESFQVLPPVDAWAHQKGFRSKRKIQRIDFHKEHGEVERTKVSPAMFEVPQ